MSKRNNKLSTIVIVGIVVLAGITIVVLAINGSSSQESTTNSEQLTDLQQPELPENIEVYRDPTTGLTTEYDKSLAFTGNETPVQGVLFSMGSDDPSLNITATLSKVDGKPVIEDETNHLVTLVEDVKKQLEQTYSNYEYVSETLVRINGRPGADIVFTYDKPTGEKAKQRIRMLIKDSTQTVFINGATLADQYDEVNDKYFKQTLDRARFEN